MKGVGSGTEKTNCKNYIEPKIGLLTYGLPPGVDGGGCTPFPLAGRAPGKRGSSPGCKGSGKQY